MNTLPPGQEPHDELDELYRRASERDPSRPSEATRRAVLAHAERVAAARLSAPPRSSRRARWWPAAFGTLAAGILAALLVVPSHFEPGVSPAPARKPAAAPAELAANAARAPAAPLRAEPDQAGKVSDSERRAAGAPAAPPQVPPALALREAQTPRPRAQFVPEPAAAASEERAAAPADAPRDAATSTQEVVVTGALSGARAAAGAAARDSQPEGIVAALHRAAAAGDASALEGLLGQATDVNARDSSGRTALLVAVLHGRGQAIATLLAHGADPNAADTAGITPLAAALARGDTATAETLRRHGAR